MAATVTENCPVRNESLNISGISTLMSSVTENDTTCDESSNGSVVSSTTATSTTEKDSLNITEVSEISSVIDNRTLGDESLDGSKSSEKAEESVNDGTEDNTTLKEPLDESKLLEKTEGSVVNGTMNGSTISESNCTSSAQDSDDEFDDSRDKIRPEDEPVITADMIAEEKKLEKQRLKDEMKQQQEIEARVAEEERAARYKKLMTLLNKSKFYGKFIADRLMSGEVATPGKYKKAGGRKGRGKAKAANTLENGNVGSENVKPVKEEPSDANSSQSKLAQKNGVKSSQDEDVDVSKSTSRKRKLNSSQDADEDVRPAKMKKEDEDNLDDKKYKEEKEEEETFVTEQGFTASVRQPSLFSGGSLRDYQLDGLDWLKALFENGVNGILADEMGLGKTAQVIAFISHLIEMNTIGPFLIIGPLSTLPNWMMEFQRFAPKIPILLFHGDAAKRSGLKSQFRKKSDVNGKKVFPVILTSYEIPLMERAHMRQYIWKFIIVDEGHRLKNHKTQLAQELRMYNSVNRLLLTGTPLQNELSELWSLLNFLLPELFNDLNAFESWLDLSIFSNNGEALIAQEKSSQIVSTLHQILAPFMLRRRKVDVEINIPPKKELLVYAPMTTLQLDLYKATVDRSIAILLGQEKERAGQIIPDNPDGTRARRSTARPEDYKFPSLNWYVEQDSQVEEPISKVVEVIDRDNKNFKLTIKMQNSGMQLRKIVNHPFLIQMPLKPGTREILVTEDLVKKSGKLLVLDAMLTKLKERGHKVLIFSTFCMVLDLLEEYMIMREYQYERLDGMCKIEDRMESIKSFNTDPEVFCFLISTRAGGLGINLTAADTVIIYDSDWNPQADLQAQDRCHRIGQTKPVVVYRFVTERTVDEAIVQRAAAKRKLEKLVIQDGHFKDVASINKPNLVTLQKLRDLLNARDYQKAVHSNGFIFTDAELDALLDRSDMLNEKPVLKPSNSIFTVIHSDPGSL